MTLAAPVGGFVPRSSRFWSLGTVESPDVGFNGLDPFGVEWAIKDPRGWHASPPVNLGLEDKPLDGAWFGRGAYRPRVVEVSGAYRTLCAQGDVADVLDDAAERLQAALDPSIDTLLAVTERIPKQLTVRPSSEVIVDPVYRQPRARIFSFVVTAADPFKYAAGAAGEEQITMSLLDPASVPGFTHPMEHPLDHGGAPLDLAGRRTVINIGQIPALPVLRIVGPAAYPTILNATTGAFFTLDRILPLGAEAIIDMELRTVHVGGSSDFSAKAARSSFWTLAKGANDLRFTAQNFEPLARAYVSWRPRWK